MTLYYAGLNKVDHPPEFDLGRETFSLKKPGFTDYSIVATATVSYTPKQDILRPSFVIVFEALSENGVILGTKLISDDPERKESVGFPLKTPNGSYLFWITARITSLSADEIRKVVMICARLL